MLMGDCNIFREELGLRYPNHGHAIWDPDPGGLYNSVEVGDVGFIRRGYFYRLFNALHPRDPPPDSETHDDDDHGPMYPPRLEVKTPEHIRRYRDNHKDFRSKNVTKEHSGHDIYASGPDDDAQATVSCSGTQGALLSLPFPAACEDTVAQGDFGKWLVKNIDCCMRVAEALGLGVNRMEEIILVTGRHLARSWINVVFSESRVGAQLSFVVRVSGDSGVHLEERSATGGDLKLGPGGENLPENQCVFIRGYRVVRILTIWPRLRALAGPSSDMHDPETESDVHLELQGIPAETDDPLHVLLKYIAEQAPDCDMALVHDNDLEFLVNEPLETGQPDVLLEHLRKNPPAIRRTQCELLTGNEECLETKTEITSVATLSNSVFEGPHEDQTGSRARFETSFEQAKHLIGGPYDLTKNPPSTRDYMDPRSYITPTLGTDKIAQHANINVRDAFHQTPLHLALEGGDVDLAQSLIENGADVNVQDPFKSTPLHLASRGGHVGIVRMLIEHGANVNSQDDYNLTPLLHALSGGHVEIAQVLIGHGANVNTQDKYKSTPLHLASRGGHVEIAQVLIEHGADVNSQNNYNSTPLLHALSGGHVEVAHVLIGHGADVNTQDESKLTPLHLASRGGHVEIARLFIKHGADVNSQDNYNSTPLLHASRGGHVEVAQVLIGHGADVNTQDKSKSTPLLHALSGGHVEIARVFIKHGADVNSQDNYNSTPLLHALSSGHVDIAQVLIEHGAGVNAQDKSELTPLHLASRGGHVELARVLIEHGADVNSQDNHNSTPLLRALSGGHVEIARVLIEHGADVNAQDNSKSTPLCLALRGGHKEIAQVLIEHGADENAQGDSGSTPLHLGLRGGHVQFAGDAFMDYPSDEAEAVLQKQAEAKAASFSHTHAEEQEFRVARVPIGQGADVKAQDSYESTPLHRAHKRRRERSPTDS